MTAGAADVRAAGRDPPGPVRRDRRDDERHPGPAAGRRLLRPQRHRRHRVGRTRAASTRRRRRRSTSTTRASRTPVARSPPRSRRRGSPRSSPVTTGRSACRTWSGRSTSPCPTCRSSIRRSAWATPIRSRASSGTGPATSSSPASASTSDATAMSDERSTAAHRSSPGGGWPSWRAASARPVAASIVPQLGRVEHLQRGADPQQLVVGDLDVLRVDGDRTPAVTSGGPALSMPPSPTVRAGRAATATAGRRRPFGSRRVRAVVGGFGPESWGPTVVVGVDGAVLVVVVRAAAGSSSMSGRAR